MGEHGEFLTTRQMQATENAAIAAGIPGLALMERAGKAAAHTIATQWPMPDGLVLILCGPGNNGGDGYVVARHLAALGWQIRVVAIAPSTSADAQAAARAWTGAVMPLGAWAGTPGSRIVLCIDAMFGTGISRPLGSEIAGLLRGIAAAGVPIVALDILSGVCATSGRVLGGVALPDAALTVTFHRPKLGHVLDQGGALSGTVICCDIGLEEWATDPGVPSAGPSVDLGKRTGHKYSHGHALVLSGGCGKGGAARLAAQAALRVGAGLVTLACPAEALPENAARLDAVMLTDVQDLTPLLRDPRLGALCLGPGLGLDRAPALVASVLQARRATVLDADALTAFADAPETLFRQLHDRVVLTPHDGEFARLFPDLARPLHEDATKGPAYSRLDAARLASARSGAVVLLKGPGSVIAAPDGRAVIAAATGAQAAPWLATAGSGDVLSGIITGLMARGFAPVSAAATGAWLHAESARSFGPGLIAEDLSRELPKVFRNLGL